MTTIERPPVDNLHQEPSQPEKPKKSRKGLYALLGGATATALLGGGLFFGLKSSGETQPGYTPDEEGTGTEQIDDTPEAGEYMVDLEALSQMSPEQLTELATITVESVTGPDGNIDWNLYAQKLNDIILLGTVAGTTTSEVEQVYINATAADESRYYELAEKYDTPLKAGFALPETALGGYEQIHISFLSAAEGGYLLDKGPVIRTLDLLSVEVSPESDNTRGVFRMTQHTTDNFFSSGILNANDPNDVNRIGRSTDMDATFQSDVRAVVIGSNIYLEYINP